MGMVHSSHNGLAIDTGPKQMKERQQATGAVPGNPSHTAAQRNAQGHGFSQGADLEIAGPKQPGQRHTQRTACRLAAVQHDKLMTLADDHRVQRWARGRVWANQCFAAFSQLGN